MRFLNRLPEYVLAIQQCAVPRISIAFLVASCLGTCALQQILVGFLQHTEFVCIAFQDDCIVSRMKNSAKMLPHLFTQTNENRRLITQYRCHFRRDISNVVGCDSACSRVALCPFGRGFEASMLRRSHFLHSRSVCLVDGR